MHYQIDLDHTHSVIRLTVMEEVVSLELAEDVYARLKRFSSSDVVYAAIYDLSATKDTTIPVEVVRSFARRAPSVPMGRQHVVVGTAPAIFELARIFQMCGEAVGEEFEVVHTMDEAYEIVEARPEDFTERLFDTDLAA